MSSMTFSHSYLFTPSSEVFNFLFYLTFVTLCSLMLLDYNAFKDDLVHLSICSASSIGPIVEEVFSTRLLTE